MPRIMKKGRELQKDDHFLYMDKDGLRPVVIEEVHVAVTISDGCGGRKTIHLKADEEFPLQ